MFAIDRYDPSNGGNLDKQDRLNSFNDRLKRKRANNTKHASGQDTPTTPAPGTPELPDGQTTEPHPIQAGGETTESATASRQPHREKRSKRHAQPAEVKEDDNGQIKVAHILKTFHKIQERAAQAEVESDTVESAADSDIEIVADLAPIPQSTKGATKRQTLSTTAGLPQYLKSPHLVSPTQSVSFAEFKFCRKIRENLKKCEFEDAFAVQAALLPVLLGPHLPERRKDILVSAPTGSGKTLTYVLPILETLHARRITRLRAIVIVPTRELVQQVQATFESLSSKLGLKILALSATRPFAEEQALLIRNYEPLAPSNVDILICTPGRLVDHLKSTPKFTLQDLRFLVIDEGDRLLAQSFQNWTTEINEALTPLHSQEEEEASAIPDVFVTKSEERCQKLIFSATLSTDPALLAQLQLVRPALYLVQDHHDDGNDAAQTEAMVSKFTTPATLSEFFVHVPDAVPKPLVLLTAIHRMSIPKALVFTNSNASAVKLATLMRQCCIGRCESFTSTLLPSLRRRHLTDFADAGSTLRFLICSDLMARGIDTVVPCVINYDSSISSRSYIHRVGRTARAGNTGRALSLVSLSEGAYWWNQIGKKVKRSRVIQRVTLFPKKQRSEGQVDVTLGDTPQDEVHSLPAAEDVLTTAVELVDVDSEALRNVYEVALAHLQAASSTTSITTTSKNRV